MLSRAPFSTSDNKMGHGRSTWYKERMAVRSESVSAAATAVPTEPVAVAESGCEPAVAVLIVRLGAVATEIWLICWTWNVTVTATREGEPVGRRSFSVVAK